MKKVKYLLISVITFLCILGSCKANSINSIDMEIYIDEQGNGHITETWDADVTEGTEGYKTIPNIGNAEISDLKVSMDGKEFTTLSYWNTSDTFSSKAYHAGINNISNGAEICFGISKYGSHTYKVSYTIEGFVLKTEDSDIVYWTLIPRKLISSGGEANIVIYADEPFIDDLPVWGYDNYGGLAYVYDGKIYMSNDNLLNNESLVLLAKFPSGTFATYNTDTQNFDYYKEMADDGAYAYREEKAETNIVLVILGTIVSVGFSFLYIFIIVFAVTSAGGNKRYENNIINMKEVPHFRDLPANKDIFRAYFLADTCKLTKKQTDFLGTILLKWLNDDQISITKTYSKILKKENTAIDLSKPFSSTNVLEEELHEMMTKASGDKILEQKEFEKWCGRNYSKLFNWFKDVLEEQRNDLVQKGLLTVVEKKKFKLFKYKVYTLTPSLKDEAIKLAGIKKFLQEFSSIEDKSAIEVKLWKEYLMYAQIFGIANKVVKEFKKLYPEYINDVTYSDIFVITSISYSGVNSASSARSRAQSYSSGGGGFSSGGGGGGSFGGGGGGGFR